MIEKDVLILMEEAWNKNDIAGLRESYKIGKRNLTTMPKVNDIFAFFMYQKGFFAEALEASRCAIFENRSRLEKRSDAKALFDYALCSYNSVDIIVKADINDNNFLSCCIANSLYYFSLSYDAYLKSDTAPSEDGNDPWWTLDGPILIQQYYMAELFAHKSFPTLLDKLKLSEDDFDRFYHSNITFRLVIYAIDRLIKAIKSAPPNPILKEILKQAFDRCSEIRGIAFQRIKQIEQITGRSGSSYLDNTPNGSIKMLIDKLETISKKDPYFLKYFK